MASETAGVVITVHKPDIDNLERLSLSRCVSVLGRHPLVFVGPRSLDFSIYCEAAPAARVVVFDDRHFASYYAYNEFMVRPLFYETFKDEFRFILKYELDAFVFEDQLLEWCARDWDYIGAPWKHHSVHWTGVGNAGFSLRKVNACLEVLRSTRKLDPNVYWKQVRHISRNPLLQSMRYGRKLMAHLGLCGNVDKALKKFVRLHECCDWFWGQHAARYSPSWRLAPVEEAMRFSVEAGLEETAPLFKERPPFGCHRRWFLEMLHRYLFSVAPPMSEYEQVVWDLGRVAGLKRRGGGP